MSESTLTAAYNDLLGDVGNYLGYSRGEVNGETEWDDFQERNILRCVKGGLRAFYYCGHDWSFLQPLVSVGLGTGSYLVDLPDDFDGITGRIAVIPSTGTSQCWITPTGVGVVSERRASAPDSTGWPQLIAVEAVKGTTPQRSNRYRLSVFPTADADYTLRFQQLIRADFLTGTMPYAYGGPAHAETLLSACKACAERDLDDIPADRGTQQQEFQRLLQLSIDMDRRMKPAWLGYNADRQRTDFADWRRRDDTATVTFDGVSY